MALTESANRILDIAETRMRRTGYNAVSYRDIASEMGIKSASLHYHFPQKKDLGVALVKRYAANFNTRLSEKIKDTKPPQDKLNAFVELCRNALEDHELICLCAVLGAEAPGIPEEVTAEVRTFFTGGIDWLTGIFTEMSSSDPAAKAKVTVSLIEGAMIVSSVNRDVGVFDAAAHLITSDSFIH